ncbi:MAG: FecR family protein [Caulobacteraceae bacterium]
MRAEAAAWLARLQSDAPTAQDRAGCEAWLSASEAHRRALAEATALWDAAGGLPLSTIGRSPKAPAKTVDRRAVLAGLLGTGCAVAAWSTLAPRSYANGVGPAKTVRLSDGSSLMLDACSEVKAAFGMGLRQLELVRGRVALSPATASDRPVVVTRGSRRLLAFGRSLDIACLGEGLAVTAVDGLVVVQRPGRDMVRLESGERLTWSGTAGLRTDRPTLEAVTAWRDGRLVFADDTLADAVAEINRYSLTPIAVEDAALLGLRISGSYRTRSAKAFAQSVAMLYGLQLVSEPGRFLLRRA